MLHNDSNSKRTSLCQLPRNAEKNTLPVGDRFPDIVFPRESLSTGRQDQRRCNSRGAVLMPLTEPLPKRIVSTYMERGALAALAEAKESESRLVATVAAHLLSLGNWICAFWSCDPPESTMNLLAKHSATRNWYQSAIRTIAWHPHFFKLAVATVDDTVFIYTPREIVAPVLQSELQKSIACVAWRPNASGELAVGCQNGALIWSVDPTSQISRPFNPPIHLQHGRKHRPVSALCWSPSGELLITASVSDSELYVWSIDQQTCVRLHHLGPPSALVSYGPGGRYLLRTSVEKHFYITDTAKLRYSHSRWTTVRGALQSFAWSQEEDHLIYVTTEDQELYHTRLGDKAPNCDMGCPLVDLKSWKTEGGVTVGGYPQSVAWCPQDRFVAIAFKDTSEIAIFLTSIDKFNFSINPYSYVSGLGLDYPCCMQFQQNCAKSSRASSSPTESILTVAWSAGHIAYYSFK